MKNRLIELLSKIKEDATITCPRYSADVGIDICKGCQYDQEDGSCDYAARDADHLLANGVIVPPCKVGDVVYIITSFAHKKILEFQVEEIVANGRDIFLCSTHGEEFAADLCYSTKAEAEQALKGGAE